MVDRVAAAAGVLYSTIRICDGWGKLPQSLSVLALDLRDGPCTTGDGLVATLALPDTNGLALDSVLSAECAGVSGMLSDFHLLDLLTKRGTITVTTCQ
jgi:hypothetical protein